MRSDTARQRKRDDREKRLRHVHGGPHGVKPIKPPNNSTEWRPGMPTHWLEQSAFHKRKSLAMRLVSFLQLSAGIVYLQYRARKTIGVFESSKHPAVLTYQIFFFVLEIISLAVIVFRLFETWNITYRNCVDFKRIPNDLIISVNSHDNPQQRNKPSHQQSSQTTPPAIPRQFCNYPSVAVFIPCYNEDVDLVTETLVAALQIDYPTQLLTVYLCDDGKDLAKRHIVSQLRHQYKNVHYVIRPKHEHAKAGNLNYAIERSQSDLIVTLDADFVARPNLLQRLLPYYYVWNPVLGMYEFNHTLAYVQTPQFYRNLSPYDSDPLDQRSIFFFDIVMPGKDWFNASTLVGTTNLINRTALKKARYYPYHSITEDTALSIVFHGLGFRSYYVKESLATGLATTSLWANLRQRARWLKGDWQILFSRHGPLSQKGLSIAQRLLYLNMSFARLISVIHLLYDIAIILLLTLDISPLDAKRPVEFIIYLAVYILMGIVNHYVLSFGGGGIDKSESANIAFEAIFRYTTVKGLFVALFRGDQLKFKVTDKPAGNSTTHRPNHISSTTTSNTNSNNNTARVSVQSRVAEQFAVNPNNRGTVLGQPGPGLQSFGVELVHVGNNSLPLSQHSTPLHSRRPSSITTVDAQDPVVVGAGIADDDDRRDSERRPRGGGAHDYYPEVINMPPPVATLPPSSTGRPPPYPSSRGSTRLHEQTPTEQHQAHPYNNSSTHDQASYDPTRAEYDDDAERGSWLTSQNQLSAATTSATITSPPMTRTGTHLMGAMSEDDDDDDDNTNPNTNTNTNAQRLADTRPQDVNNNSSSYLISTVVNVPATQPHAMDADEAAQQSSRRETLRSGLSSSDEYSESGTTEDEMHGAGAGRLYKHRVSLPSNRSRNEEERQERRLNVRKNLKRVWFNALMILVMIYAIAWGILFPPPERFELVTNADGQTLRYEYKNLLPTGLALGFALCNLLPHLLALYLCFIPYLSGWMMTDLRNGRCDQWAVHPKTGRLFVPFSFISLLSVARLVLIVGAVVISIVASLASEVQIEMMDNGR